MRITKLEAIPVRVPLKAGMVTKTAHGDHHTSDYVIVKVHTDDGLVGLGEAQSDNSDYAGAERSIDEALRLDTKQFGPSHPDVARDLETQGMNAFFDNHLDRAQGILERALQILRTAGQEAAVQLAVDPARNRHDAALAGIQHPRRNVGGRGGAGGASERERFGKRVGAAECIVVAQKRRGRAADRDRTGWRHRPGSVRLRLLP